MTHNEALARKLAAAVVDLIERDPTVRRYKALERVAAAARRRLEVWTRQTYDELAAALAALDALDGAKETDHGEPL